MDETTTATDETSENASQMADQPDSQAETAHEKPEMTIDDYREALAKVHAKAWNNLEDDARSGFRPMTAGFERGIAPKKLAGVSRKWSANKP